jgi:serine/threonine protein kinase
MTPERWAEIERLYYAALPRGAGDRAAFLEDACGTDQELRREVESLLRYEPKAAAFLESADRRPAWLRLLRPKTEPPHAARLVGRAFDGYEVQGLIATGGMSEVYRALDTRLRRLVAIKVLPEHLSDDVERRERFHREARLVSSLNHPHVCALHHVGTHDGFDYLVMEHLEGETLQHRLSRGPMKWTEALAYLIQIADALESAHRQGIVHRDLKPANVMITKSGAKVLDFGLGARRARSDGPAEDPGLHGSKGLTVEGRIMGTVPYMAPEQLQGKSTDHRADIFAFGALAYEMLAGKAAFDADSPAGVIGAILKDTPESILTKVPEVPPLLARATMRCLSKEPRDRWQTTTDLLYELRSVEDLSAGKSWHPVAHRATRRWISALWIGTALLALIAALWMWPRTGTAPSGNLPPVSGAIRFPLHPPQGTTFPSSFDVPFALSPDGRHITFVAAAADNARHLWLRALDSEHHQQLPGTEDASSPFWSPDNQWIGFFAGGSLKKIRVTSPIVQVIATNAGSMAGAAGGRDDVILFPGTGGLQRVSANEIGGTVTRVGNDKNAHLWPQFLEDGEHYLYVSFNPRNLWLGSLAGEAPRRLMTFPVNVSTLAHVPGFVLFAQDGALYARPFDERRREFTGDATRILDGVPVWGPGRAPFSVSAAGVLAFWTETVGTPAVLRWVAKDGTISPGIEAPAKYFGFALSPDGSELAFSRVGTQGGGDLWVRTLATGAERQLTFDGLMFTPRWSPDGSQILFTAIPERPPPTIFVKHARLPGAAVSLGSPPGPLFASSWSGDVLLGVRAAGKGGVKTDNDLWMQRAGSAQWEPVPFTSDFSETEGSLSRDARWLAYTSDQTGRDEVWVASFPSGAVRRQVSLAGGRSPQWCGDQDGIAYLAADKRLVIVPFRSTSGGLQLGDLQPLFRLDDFADFDRSMVATANFYAAAADCQRFLVAARAPDAPVAPISIVANWPVLLGR